MTWLVFAPAALALAGYVLYQRLKHYMDRPLTPLDFLCDRVDQALDAEAEREFLGHDEHSMLVLRERRR